MLRITTQERRHPLTLSVEGRLTAEWGPFLERHCDTVLRSSPGLNLDLTGVVDVDPRGIAVLKRLKERGIRLIGCSQILQDLVEASVR